MIPIPEGDFQGFIFDCDGTLAHSIEVHYHAWVLAFEKHGAHFEYTWELFRSLGGMGLVEQTNLLKKRFNLDFDINKLLQDQQMFVDANIDKIRPNHGVVETAYYLSQTHPVSVASGGSREHVHKTLKVIGAWDIFSIVVTQDDVKKSKPAPDLFLLAAKKMSIPPKKCLVFEDTQIGIEAAKHAGMQYILVTEEP